MKSLFLVLTILVCACASRVNESGPWLIARGRQIHRVEVRRNRESVEGPAFLSFLAAANLSDTEAHITALSPLGTTLFAVDDRKDASTFALSKVSPLVGAREGDLRRVYGRLRPLLWARAQGHPRDIKILETNSDQSAKKLLWNLGPYTIQIEVEAQ